MDLKSLKIGQTVIAADKLSIEALEKEFKGKHGKNWKITRTEVSDGLGGDVLMVKVESPENHVSKDYYLGNKRETHYDLEFDHNTYDIGKTPKEAFKKFSEKVDEKFANLYEGGDPKALKKQAKDLVKELAPISSAIIKAGNDLRDLVGNWAGEDGSRWRTMRYSIHPEIRKLINQLKSVSFDHEPVLHIEKEAEKLV